MAAAETPTDQLICTAKADARQRRIVRVVLVVSLLFFLLATPFARRQLPRLDALLPFYVGALIAISLVVGRLMVGEYQASRRRSVAVVAGICLFSTLMAFAHLMSFPGLFAAGGIIGGGTQTTAWIYFFWHGGFSLLLLGYAVLANYPRDTLPAASSLCKNGTIVAIAASAFAGALTLLATLGHDSLLPLMQGDSDLAGNRPVAFCTWALNLAALIALWQRRKVSLLDLWLMATACMLVFETGLAAVMNHARFDVGWYAGRIYGLLAAAFILVRLLDNYHRLLTGLAVKHENLQQESLARAESDAQRLALALRASHSALWEWDIVAGGVVWDEEMFRLFALDPALNEAGFTAWRSVVHPDDLPSAGARIAESVRDRVPLFNRFRIVLPSGEVRWIEAYGDICYDENDHPLRMNGICLDATARLNAERQVLLQAEILEKVTDGVNVVSQSDGRIVCNNPAFEAMFGYGRDELLGRSTTVLYDASDAVAEAIKDEIVGALRATGSWQGDVLSRRKDGSTFWSSANISSHDLAHWGPIWLGILRDVTARKHRETERVAALTRQRDVLVREVHHRIKNHLHGVAGLLQARIDDCPQMAAPLREAIVQVEAIAAVYGLHGAASENRIELDRIIALLAKGAAGPVAVAYSQSGEERFLLGETDAVPLALVINELITNGIKHLQSPDSQRPVRVRLTSVDGGAAVEVCNGPARLPAAFDFARQLNTGTGLELVATLLPPEGAQLTFRQRGDEVSAELRLLPPVLSAN